MQKTNRLKKGAGLLRTRLRCAAHAQEQRVDVVLGAGRHTRRMTDRSGEAMLELIAAVLVILWVLGFATSTTMNGFIHVLLVIAVVIILVRVIGGRSPV